jgi:uncharacterized membrane-anchored protein
MNVDLILDPRDVDQTVPVFKSLLGNYRFVEGHRYADFVKGDKLAGYGLTALIAGGAGAIAVKTGLLAKFWKLIVTVFVAMWKAIAVFFAALVARFKQVLAWIKGLFSKKEKEVPAELAAPAGVALLDSPHSPDPSAAETVETDMIKQDHAGD